MSISKINIEISDVLKQDYNEVIYKSWLTFIETAELDNGNVIVSVPNQYIKETFEERYALDIEELYRNRISFGKLIVKTPSEQLINVSNSFPLTINNTIFDMSEMVNSYIKDIYNFIESAVKNGNRNVSCVFLNDSIIIDELYWRIKEFLLNKGFKTELLSSNNNYTLSLSW
jgi:chromosomal replication initiation ATPase DnaA